MPSFLTLEGRRSKRILSKNPRGSLVVNLDRNQKNSRALYLIRRKAGSACAAVSIYGVARLSKSS